MDTFYGLYAIVFHTQVLADVWVVFLTFQMAKKSCVSFITKKEIRMNQEGASKVFMTFINNVSWWYKANNKFLQKSSVD